MLKKIMFIGSVAISSCLAMEIENTSSSSVEEMEIENSNSAGTDEEEALYLATTAFYNAHWAQTLPVVPPVRRGNLMPRRLVFDEPNVFGGDPL